MKSETIEGWVKVYETIDFMEAELIEARLQDESIEFQLLNKADIAYTMEVGNNPIGRGAVNIPLKFFVQPEDKDQAMEIINEDRSALLDDPNINFDDPEISIDNPDDNEDEEDI
jgi:hypothetical protein